MYQPLTEESFRQAMIEECRRVEDKFTVYKVTGFFAIIITVIILIITIIWTFNIPNWLKYASSGILSLVIIYLAYLIYQSALVSNQACYY